MARKSKGPWYWESRHEYVVDVRGKRYYLGPDKKAATKEWHTLMSESRPIRITSGSVIGILDQFLEWTQKNREPATYQWYHQRLADFAGRFPELTIAELKPHHVQKWMDTKKSVSHKRGCAIAICRAMNWADKQGFIDRNPLRALEKPAAVSRDVVLSSEQYDKIVANCSDQAFRDLIEFCGNTGCRPQEAFALEARHFEVEHARCVFPKNESKGKKKSRVIYLNDLALAMINRLVAAHPSGKLFRNEDGNPWHRNNVHCRFTRMKKKLGFKPMLYHLRHTFITNALKAGNDPVTVAVLAGHDPATLARVYQHLHQDSEHLQKALRKLN